MNWEERKKTLSEEEISERERAYKALNHALEQYSGGEYRSTLAKWKKTHKTMRGFQLPPPSENAERMIKAMSDVLKGDISVEEAFAILHEPEIFIGRFR